MKSHPSSFPKWAVLLCLFCLIVIESFQAREIGELRTQLMTQQAYISNQFLSMQDKPEGSLELLNNQHALQATGNQILQRLLALEAVLQPSLSQQVEQTNSITDDEMGLSKAKAGEIIFDFAELTDLEQLYLSRFPIQEGNVLIRGKGGALGSLRVSLEARDGKLRTVTPESEYRDQLAQLSRISARQYRLLDEIPEELAQQDKVGELFAEKTEAEEVALAKSAADKSINLGGPSWSVYRTSLGYAVIRGTTLGSHWRYLAADAERRAIIDSIEDGAMFSAFWFNPEATYKP